MVARAGHVGHVGRYGLDLPHELIADPGVILQSTFSPKLHHNIEI